VPAGVDCLLPEANSVTNTSGEKTVWLGVYDGRLWHGGIYRFFHSGSTIYNSGQSWHYARLYPSFRHDYRSCCITDKSQLSANLWPQPIAGGCGVVGKRWLDQRVKDRPV